MVYKQKGFGKGTVCMFILAFFALLCSFQSQAAQPQINVMTSKGLTIMYPPNPFYEVNKNIQLNFHVFNGSNFALNNKTTVCNIHIYDNKGTPIVEKNQMIMDPNLLDYIYYLNNTVFNNVSSDYPYIMWCNNSVEGGFISGTFTVQDKSKLYESTFLILPATMSIIPLFFALICLIGAISLGKEHAALRIGLFLLSFIPVFMSLQIIMLAIVRYYGWNEMQNSIADIVFRLGVIFAAIISYFIIYLIATIFHIAAQKKQARLEY